ncbi:hypothetical protein CMK12_08790 [Candidatus Poribacteria bacterium]|jgi:hypothetical protein|nr:hypothetical protein [Candidatus Poribacteria bacterium]
MNSNEKQQFKKQIDLAIETDLGTSVDITSLTDIGQVPDLGVSADVAEAPGIGLHHGYTQCKFCDQEFDIDIRQADDREIIRQHYFEVHHDLFMDYCRNRNPEREKALDAYIEAISSRNMDLLNEVELLLLSDSLLLAVRLGTYESILTKLDSMNS